eukprot:scaffold28626_cov64-Phaeocystis_antarctica.AAC.1
MKQEAAYPTVKQPRNHSSHHSPQVGSSGKCAKTKLAGSRKRRGAVVRGQQGAAVVMARIGQLASLGQ